MASKWTEHTWVSWTNVGLGVWLMISAFVFRHPSGAAVTENIVIGALVATSAVWAAWAYKPVMRVIASWTVALGGVWVVAAPFVLGYDVETVALANDVLVGIAIVILGAANVSARSRRLRV